MSNFVLSIGEIANLLRAKCEENGGKLDELSRIAWDAYLSTGVIDHVDYDKVRDHFPNFDTDPECNDPVNAIAIGKHYREHDPSIAEGDCLYETEFEGLSRKIGEDKKHLGGELTPGFTVAWAGKLLGLFDCKEITEEEYRQLKAMLPVLENDPVKEVEAVTRKYVGF